MQRFYVVLGNSADAETLADRLRLRGFAAEAVEPDLVAIGSVLPDRWQAGAQIDLATYAGGPCVVEAARLWQNRDRAESRHSRRLPKQPGRVT